MLGGTADEDTLRISPTIIDNVAWDNDIMSQEIFGPILPVLTFQRFEEIFQLLARRPRSLAAYLFSQDRAHIRQVRERVDFGGGCVTDTIIHLATSEMGFGGVGESGMDAYHGRAGFEALSYGKSMVDKKTWLDLPMRYQPYQNRLYGKLLHFFLR